MFREIPAEIQDLAGMKFVLKNIYIYVLKTKTNLHSVHQKTSKEKKKKKNEKKTVPFQTTWVEQMMMIKKAQKKNQELYSYEHVINKGSCNRYLQAHR